MKHFSLGPLGLDLGKESRGVGPLENVNFSCGQWLIIGAGLQTALQEEVSLTLQLVLFVIRLRKQLTT